MNVRKVESMQKPKELEKILKGCANHRRVEALCLLKQHPSLTLEEIAGYLGIDFRVASEHLRRMGTGGLIVKRYKGRYVCHTLTKRGHNILTFLRMLE